jgi:hypothetical protein
MHLHRRRVLVLLRLILRRIRATTSRRPCSGSGGDIQRQRGLLLNSETLQKDISPASKRSITPATRISSHGPESTTVFSRLLVGFRLCFGRTRPQSGPPALESTAATTQLDLPILSALMHNSKVTHFFRSSEGHNKYVRICENQVQGPLGPARKPLSGHGIVSQRYGTLNKAPPHKGPERLESGHARHQDRDRPKGSIISVSPPQNKSPCAPPP